MTISVWESDLAVSVSTDSSSGTKKLYYANKKHFVNLHSLKCGIRQFSSTSRHVSERCTLWGSSLDSELTTVLIPHRSTSLRDS